MLYILINESGVTEIHENENQLPSNAVELTQDDIIALQAGTKSFVNGVIV
jgi:hypothetical protein